MIQRFLRPSPRPWIRQLMLGVTSVALALPSAAIDKEWLEAEQHRFERTREFVAQQQQPEERSALAMTPCVDGSAGIYPCSKIDLMAFLPLSEIGGGSGNDIWGWTDRATGREYAIMGRTSGTSFVDITDPVEPIYLGNLPAHTSNSPWRDIKVYANHAFIVSEASGHGMQVFDLTQLRTVGAPPVTFSETAHYDGFGKAHNIAINEQTGYAYVVGTTTCDGGPHFVDIAAPASPTFAGCINEPVYTHDTQCVVYSGPDVAYQGREICFNANESALHVVDVTSKASPASISITSYAGASYVHQGWLTEDHRFYLLNDELDEQNFGHNTRTRVIDVQDLDAPFLVGFYDGPTTAIDHNLYVVGGYAYEANYRAGLRIVDLAGVETASMTEIAHFDIYPSSNAAFFNGAWSVYPFFASGNVVVSGIEQGLFVLRPRLAPEFLVEVDDPTLEVCAPDVAVTTVSLTGRNDYAGDVGLDAVGLPAGSSAGFDVSPVAVPGISELSVVVSSTAAGTYGFDLVGDDGTLVREAPMTLFVADAAPGAASATTPPAGAVGVLLTPTLAWIPVDQSSGYRLEIALDPVFVNVVYAVDVAIPSHQVLAELSAGTPHHWRVRGTGPCGSGPWSAARGFVTLEYPRILVVDDDDNGPDVRSAYTDALDALGQSYEVWDTQNSDNEPSASTLAPYEVAVWFTGDEFGGSAGPGAGGEQALASWLDTSRCLLIASQDYRYDRGITDFMRQRLGVGVSINDASQTSVTGAGSVFSGLGPYNLSFPYSNFTDDIIADETAEPAFDGSNERQAAIDKNGGLYRTAYLAFGLETLPDGASREAVMGRFLDWCAELPALDSDTDGAPNGEDCSPGDPAVWATPSPARQLLVSGAASDNFAWSGPAQPGAITVTYDLLRSDSALDFASAACVEAAGLDTLATDTLDPAPGAVLHYLVRAGNGCGVTTGSDSFGVVRQSGSVCP